MNKMSLKQVNAALKSLEKKGLIYHKLDAKGEKIWFATNDRGHLQRAREKKTFYTPKS